MTAPGATPPGTPRLSYRQRFGLVGFVALAVTDPLATAMTAVAWSSRGLDAFLGGIAPTFVIAIGLSLPLAIGALRRPRWWRRWFSFVGGLLLGMFALVLLVALAGACGAFRTAPALDAGDGVAMARVALVYCALVGLPGAVALICALRDRRTGS